MCMCIRRKCIGGKERRSANFSGYKEPWKGRRYGVGEREKEGRKSATVVVVWDIGGRVNSVCVYGFVIENRMLMNNCGGFRERMGFRGIRKNYRENVIYV